MSLNWDARNCAKWEELTDQEKEATVWQTMAVDIGQLTEQNICEYVARVRIYEQVHGPVFMKDAGNKSVSGWTDERLMYGLGLTTNVGYMNRGAWFRKILGRDLDEKARRAAIIFERVYGKPLPGPSPEPPAAKILDTFNDYERMRGALEAHAMDVCNSAGIELESYFLEIDPDVVQDAHDAIGKAIRNAVNEQHTVDHEDAVAGHGQTP